MKKTKLALTIITKAVSTIAGGAFYVDGNTSDYLIQRFDDTISNIHLNLDLRVTDNYLKYCGKSDDQLGFFEGKKKKLSQFTWNFFNDINFAGTKLLGAWKFICGAIIMSQFPSITLFTGIYLLGLAVQSFFFTRKKDRNLIFFLWNSMLLLASVGSKGTSGVLLFLCVAITLMGLLVEQPKNTRPSHV